MSSTNQTTALILALSIASEFLCLYFNVGQCPLSFKQMSVYCETKFQSCVYDQSVSSEPHPQCSLWLVRLFQLFSFLRTPFWNPFAFGKWPKHTQTSQTCTRFCCFLMRCLYVCVFNGSSTVWRYQDVISLTRNPAYVTLRSWLKPAFAFMLDSPPCSFLALSLPLPLISSRRDCPGVSCVHTPSSLNLEMRCKIFWALQICLVCLKTLTPIWYLYWTKPAIE